MPYTNELGSCKSNILHRAVSSVTMHSPSSVALDHCLCGWACVEVWGPPSLCVLCITSLLSLWDHPSTLINQLLVCLRLLSSTQKIFFIYPSFYQVTASVPSLISLTLPSISAMYLSVSVGRLLSSTYPDIPRLGSQTARQGKRHTDKRWVKRREDRQLSSYCSKTDSKKEKQKNGSGWQTSTETARHIVWRGDRNGEAVSDYRVARGKAGRRQTGRQSSQTSSLSQTAV